MPTQITASLRSLAWPCTAELNLAAQFVNGRTMNAKGQSVMAQAYTRPGDHRFSTQGSAMRDTKVPPIPDACEYIPDAFGLKPEPAQGDGREGEEDEQDVVGGGRVAEEEAG
jgi:hypothetical protein